MKNIKQYKGNRLVGGHLNLELTSPNLGWNQWSSTSHSLLLIMTIFRGGFMGSPSSTNIQADSLTFLAQLAQIGSL